MKGVLVAAALLLYGCGGEPAEEAGAGVDSTQDTTPQDTSAMPGMPGMTGMQGMPMMDSMEGHMRALESISPDSMRAMMPMHRRMADSAFAQMDRHMRAMNRPPDARWNALVDSLRLDMTRMQGMSDGEMRTFVAEHRARMQRLMEMNRSMMPAPAPR